MDDPAASNQPPPSFDAVKDERTWGMLCHLAGLAGVGGFIPLGNILAPLVVWLIKKDQYPLVDDQGKESLNFQISMTIYFIVALPTICLGIGLIVLPILGLLNIVMLIVAAIKANGGEMYRYPLTIRLIK